MTHPTAVPRLALWKTLSVGAIAAVASLAFTGAASAAVIVVNPDGTAGTDNIRTAITSANTNADSSNTLVLSPGAYTPGALSGSEPTITKNLVITGNHASQTTTSNASVRVSAANQASQSPGNLFVIGSGVNVTMEGFQIINGGGTGFSQIDDSGNLTLWGMSLSGAPGGGITVETGGNLGFNESTVYSAIQVGITNNGTASLDTADVVTGNSTGIVNNGTYTMHNTLVAKNAGGNCVGAADTNNGPSSMDDSPAGSANTCAVANPNSTTVDSFFPTIATHNGGPTLTFLLNAGSPTEHAGTNCQTTDQRFFVTPAGTTCDIGAVTRSAARNTTPPSCSVTGTSAGPPATQTVSVSDAGSGIGPEGGNAYEPNSQTSPQPQNARSAASIPSDAISGLGITNGTVAISTFPTAPTTSPITLTASKTTAGTLTHWWFTATDWAGNVTFCQ